MGWEKEGAGGVSRLECRGMGEGGSRGSEQAGVQWDGRRREQGE